jgi:hypothetical protein
MKFADDVGWPCGTAIAPLRCTQNEDQSHENDVIYCHYCAYLQLHIRPANTKQCERSTIVARTGSYNSAERAGDRRCTGAFDRQNA